MKILFLKSFACFLILSIGTLLPLQAQQTKNVNEKNRFIEQGTVLTGISFDFTRTEIKNDLYNPQPNYNQFAVVGVELDALYFVTHHLGVGGLLSYQSLFGEGYGNINDWDFKYGLQAGGYIPISAIFNSNSRSQFFIKSGISWVREENSFSKQYGFGYEIGLGTLLAVGKHTGVEIALNYLARSEDLRQTVIYGIPIAPVIAPVPGNPPDMNNTVWHRRLTLTVGFNLVLF